MYRFKGHQKVYLFFKRFLDIVLSFIGICVLGPFMILFALITKITSKGPVFYRQVRLGKYKKEFTMLKFRSMRIDAPDIAPSDMSDEQRKLMITPWGKFMRATSIDELPQLFNIFVGQMSFIGPRPGQPANIEAKLLMARESYTPNAFEVRPGLGGLAQFKMKRSHDPYLKAKFDSEYVEHISILMDIKLLVLTVLHIFGYGKGK